MQKATASGLRRKAAAIVALLAMCAITVSGTMAWKDYKQHKSNQLKGLQGLYEARLVEDFVEVPDWKVSDGAIKKEIRVANLGQASAGYGNVYVRLQLKEYMEIGDVKYIETEKRYMVARGQQSYEVEAGRNFTFADGHFIVFPTEPDAKRVFPNNSVAQLKDIVTGDEGWFIQTKDGDVNGQMGKYVVTEIRLGNAQKVLAGPDRAANTNHHGTVTKDAQGNITGYDIKSGECDYLPHGWRSATDATKPIDQYIQWLLNTGAITTLTAWKATGSPAVAKWILDDSNDEGWAYWGQALPPQQATANLLNQVALIKQPDGSFYYVIHVEMQAASLDEFFKAGGNGWNTDVEDSYRNNGPSVQFNGPTPTEVKEGESVPSPGVTVLPAGSDSTGLIWASSRPDLATVNGNGVVTGVKASDDPVTITVTAKNGGRAYYTIYVKPGTPVTVPAMGVSINGGNRTISIGDEETLAITKTPPTTTDTVSWASSDSTKVTVDNDGKIKGIAAGSATITVTLQPSGKTANITVTVTPAAPQNFPLRNGEGPYQMQGSTNPDNNYSIVYNIDAMDFDNPTQRKKDGTIKLKDILNTQVYGTDFTGLSVSSADQAVASKVNIGTDKDGDAAIVFKYYGTKAQWEAARPALPTNIQVTLVLSKAGYANATIKVNLTFIGSLYQVED